MPKHVTVFWYLGRRTTDVEYSFLGGRIRLPSNGSNDNGKSLLEDHVPAALQFSDISYTLSSGRRVLDGVSGAVQPGEVMAVLGASGAGKSTFLDILARKSKRGTVGGQVLVNGRKVQNAEYRRVVGFVDQEDTLMGTLTVYETVLYSALLRLPREMTFEDKRMRTLETMHELGIIGIRDSRIGESGHRSISGGEKRRVSIACELVTSPSILFLDEPTSGLDSYNAYNVVDSLVQLARNYKRTVVFTIHQPQSNIVALFDKLLLLASGKVVYSGKAEKAQRYFETIGCSCPPGFNIADYLSTCFSPLIPRRVMLTSPVLSVDLTMSEKSSPSTPDSEPLIQLADASRQDPERGTTRPRPAPVDTAASSTVDDTELDSRLNSPASLAGQAKKLFSGSSSGRNSPTSTPLPPHLARLVNAFTDSDISKETREEVNGTRGSVNGSANDSIALRNYKAASWWTQFKILSGRSFKNLYRDPMLMLSHYAVAVVAAGMCAFLFRGLT